MKKVIKFIAVCFMFIAMWIMMIVSAILMPILTLFRFEVKMKVKRK